MSWFEAITSAILFIVLAIVLFFSGLGMMFADSNPYLQRVYAVAFLASLTLALAVMFKGLS